MQSGVHACRQPMPADIGIPTAWPVFAGEFCIKHKLGSNVVGCTGCPPELHEKCCRCWVSATQAVIPCLDRQCTAKTPVGTGPVLRTLPVVQQLLQVPHQRHAGATHPLKPQNVLHQTPQGQLQCHAPFM